MIYFYSYNNENGMRVLSQAFYSTSAMVNFMQSEIYDVQRFIVNRNVKFYIEDDYAALIPSSQIVNML